MKSGSPPPALRKRAPRSAPFSLREIKKEVELLGLTVLGVDPVHKKPDSPRRLGDDLLEQVTGTLRNCPPGKKRIPLSVSFCQANADEAPW
jgi:hypothetical protein